MKRQSALVVVDVQNDFCPGGALPAKEGDKVVEPLNAYIELFKADNLPVYATRDWHPPKTTHFKEQGGDWPPHCVQNTRGGEFHPGLKLPEDAVVITKGDRPDEDAYSGFQGRDPEGRYLEEALKDAGVRHIYVGGLATDYCVKSTVVDGLEKGFRVTVLLDAVRGVDVEEGDSDRALREMTSKGAAAITLNGFRFA